MHRLKPPRFRGALRYPLTALPLLFAACFLASIFWNIGLQVTRFRAWTGGGQLAIYVDDSPSSPATSRSGSFMQVRDKFTIHWTPVYENYSSAPGTSAWLFFSLWALALAASIPVAISWRNHTKWRRLISVGLCPRCAYDRRGLDPNAPCPECGSKQRAFRTN